MVLKFVISNLYIEYIFLYFMKIKIKVKINQPKTEVLEKGDVWKVNVKAKPEQGKANLEIIKFFSKIFKKKVKIIRGLKSKNKILEINN